ncbi:repetitive organellar protein-like [Battus philenor]|uniref:repetitive organellar protein-like n=1 Tax=Battus philenor TaxID=42288 RepID=UPI0035D08670
MRLKKLYNRLAKKTRNALMTKIRSPTYRHGRTHQPFYTTPNIYRKYNIDEQYPNLDNGRRNLKNEDIKISDKSSIETKINVNPLNENVLNKLNNQNEAISNLDANKIFKDNAKDTENYDIKNHLNADLNSQEHATQHITNKDNVVNIPSLKLSANTISGNRNLVPQFKNADSWYSTITSPFYSITKPINGLFNTVKYPINKFIGYNNNLFNYENGQYQPFHLYNQNELDDIKSYIKQIMNADHYENPVFFQIINEANKLDLSKLENLDLSQMIKISESDLKKLKGYLGLLLNKYGMTPYIFKLLEFINLVEGKPKNESYLLFKVLNDHNAIHNLNNYELNVIKGHLHQMVKEYGANPYILPIVHQIETIQVEPNNNRQVYVLDFGDIDWTSFVNEQNMMKIYSYLLHLYNRNPYFIRVLNNLNNIYTSYNSFVPVLDLNEYQSLSYLNKNDLNLLFNYISQILKQRGENNYLRQLLAYIQQLQNVNNGNININIVTNDENSGQKIDLSMLQKYLLHHYNKGELKPEIIETLKRLLLNKYNNDKELPHFIFNSTGINEIDLHTQEILKHLNESIKNPNINTIVQPSILNNTVVVSAHDLEQIYKYLLSKNSFITSPYIANILHLIQQAKIQPYSNGIVKINYKELDDIYKYIISQGQDLENPIFIKIQQLINEADKDKNIENEENTKPKDSSEDIRDVINEQTINLDKLYNFLLYKIQSDKPDLWILETLRHINKTFLNPNGQLKVKIVNLTNTETSSEFNPSDIQVLLLYLQNLKVNKNLRNELAKYVKEESKKEEDQKILLLSSIPRDSLKRIKIFLSTLMKEHGEIPDILQILVRINRVLGESDNDSNDIFISPNSETKVNENDLDFLTKYLSDVIAPNVSNNLINIYKYINQSKGELKKEKEKKTQVTPLEHYVLEIVDQYDTSPTVKDILKQFFVDHNKVPLSDILDINLINKLTDLSQDDLSELNKYLLQILHRFGLNPRLQQILFTIDKIKGNTKKDTDTLITSNTTHPNDREQKNDKQTVIITGDNLNFLNKNILDLINQYGDDPNIRHVLYRVNQIAETPGKDNDLFNVNNIAIMKPDDMNLLTNYLLQIINQHGANSHLIKLLHDINKLRNEPVRDVERSIVDINDTHIVASLDQDDIKRIKSILIEITNKYGPNPYLVNILNDLNLRSNEPYAELNIPKPSVYTFERLNENNLNELIHYILKLMETHGAQDELIEMLNFIYQIFDVKNPIKSNKKPQYVLEISKEIRKLKQQGVPQIVQNMDKSKLNYLFGVLLQNILVGPNMEITNDLPTIMARILMVYNNEIDPINKYVILKLYEYLLNNKGVGSANIWSPEFVDVILNFQDDGNSNTSKEKYVVIKPYDYIKGIKKVLNKKPNSTNVGPQIDGSNDKNNEKIINYTIYDSRDHDDHHNKKHKHKDSCDSAKKKFDKIWKALNKALHPKQHDVDFTLNDLYRLFDIFITFKKKLNLKYHKDISTGVLIDELEKNLLQNNTRRQEQTDASNLIMPIVNSLNDGITQLRSSGLEDDEVKEIVESTIKDVMPEINKVTVQECVARAKKEILDGLQDKIVNVAMPENSSEKLDKISDSFNDHI